MTFPDYGGASIVNLMASVIAGLGGERSLYPPLRCLNPETVAAHRNLLLLVIDGLGYRYLDEAGSGTWLQEQEPRRLTSVFPSTTAAAITSFLTGDAPQQHALTGWHMYFRELGAVLAVLPGEPRYGGVGLRQAGIEPASLFQHRTLFDRIPVESFVVAPRFLADSDFNLAHRGPAQILDFETFADSLSGIGRLVRSGRGRHCIYAYWSKLDHLCHVHGVGSQNVRDHLWELDGMLADFVDRLRGTDTLVLITADHGMLDIDEAAILDLDAHPSLSDTLMLPLCGERRAAYAYPWPDRAREFVTRMGDAFGDRVEVHESRELVERGVFGLGPPHPRLLERIGVYTLLPRANFVVTDRLLGEGAFDQIGVHGGASEEEMYVPLVVTSV